MNEADNLEVKERVGGGYAIVRKPNIFETCFVSKDRAQFVLDSWRNAGKLAKETERLKDELEYCYNYR